MATQCARTPPERPVALLRAPEGVGGERFFLKHAGKAPLPGLRELDAHLWPGHEPLLEARTREALLGAVQMNTLEFHAWNARLPRLDKPDRMIFDLDPGEGVDWRAVCEGARLVRERLGQLGQDQRRARPARRRAAGGALGGGRGAALLADGGRAAGRGAP